jgi:hypothetical protein
MKPYQASGTESFADDEPPVATASAFVRAAIIANLCIVAILFVVLIVTTFNSRDRMELQLWLWLVLVATLAIWITSGFLGVIALFTSWLCKARRRKMRPPRFSTQAKRGVWDEWLDLSG